MQDLSSKAEWYQKEASNCAELAKSASPYFVREIYRKVAVRYAFMGEKLQKGHDRQGDVIERAARFC
jgi:hypothetical protein